MRIAATFIGFCAAPHSCLHDLRRTYVFLRSDDLSRQAGVTDSLASLPAGPLGLVAATASEATCEPDLIYSCSGVLPRKQVPSGSCR